VEPDDFWKHLREWDFVSQYNTMIWQQNHPNEASLVNANAELGRKPLPNVFLSPHHYKAAWAPLHLAECRAQLMQGAMRNMNEPLLVEVKTTATGAYRRGGNNSRNMTKDAPWLEENETGCYVQIRPKHRGQGGKLPFMANDLVLLLTASNKDILRQIQQGTARPPQGGDLSDPSAFKSAALIGHTEASYREVNGMTVKVSRRKWIQLGKEEMYLVKIGSNVTALREFTALCRVDNLPTRRFILGQHLEDEVHRRKLSRNQSAQQLLDQMGGSQALGAGFIDYARRKFNASQLAAIAASAHEYGEGGFSLIKGPPGTGKCYPSVSSPFLVLLHAPSQRMDRRLFVTYYREDHYTRGSLELVAYSSIQQVL
jgi:senataxin